MRTKIGILLLMVIGLVMIYPNAARGQAVNNAQMHGTVTDPTGAVVPNANIQATHVATGSPGDGSRFVGRICPDESCGGSLQH